MKWIQRLFMTERERYLEDNSFSIHTLYRRRIAELNGWKIINRVLAQAPDGEYMRR
jgi:hypothetical protein